MRLAQSVGETPLRVDRVDCTTVDIEFSLALHTKTGKYFIGRDVIAALGDVLANQLYWRWSATATPKGWAARIIGRLLVMEVAARVRSRLFDRLAPRRRPPRRVIHMDAFTVLIHRLRADDVVVCHDVGPLSDPSLFDRSVVAAYIKAYDEIAAAGPHVVFVSEASMRAFRARFPGPFASLRVIYPPLRAEVSRPQGPPPGAIEVPFLLSVGAIGDRKNQATAIAAFERSRLARQGVGLVLCGGLEPGHERVRAAAAATAGVQWLGYVRDDMLAWLYQNASGFVLMSLLEGFGIPIAEATAQGLVPLVSADGVFEEVAGDGALYADPRDVDEIARQMRRLVDMSAEERGARLAKLANSVQRFTAPPFVRDWRAVVDAASRDAAADGGAKSSPTANT